MYVVNLTPHPVVVLDGDAEAARFEPSGVVARIREVVTPLGVLATDDGPVAVASLAYAEDVEGLPEPMEGTAYLVSRLLAGVVARGDLLFPGGEVRDGHGQIVGCRYLARLSGGEGA